MQTASACLRAGNLAIFARKLNMHCQKFNLSSFYKTRVTVLTRNVTVTLLSSYLSFNCRASVAAVASTA